MRVPFAEVGTRMRAVTFDGLEGAVSAYIAVLRGNAREPDFGSAVIDITTHENIDEHAAAKAVAAVSKTCRRLYASVKYGSPKHRLSNRDKRQCKPAVTRPAANTMRFDFTSALRNAWGAAKSWAAPPEQSSLWDKLHDLLDAKTTRLDQEGTRQLLKHVVTLAAICLTTVGLANVYSHNSIESQKADNNLTLELARMQFQAGATALAKADREKIAQDTEAMVIRVSSVLSELNRKDPVYRFVGAQIEHLRPALFEVLAESGGGMINGVEFTSIGAKTAAKQVKSNARKSAGPWSTTVAITS